MLGTVAATATQGDEGRARRDPAAVERQSAHRQRAQRARVGDAFEQAAQRGVAFGRPHGATPSA